MTIGSAMSIAVAGLSVNQAETNVVAQNISRAGQDGYTAKRVSVYDFQNSLGVVGLKAVVQREFDKTVWGQLLQSTAPNAYLDTQKTHLEQVDQFMGQTTSGGNLSKAIADFDAALSSLTTSPSDRASQIDLINKAQTLASRLNQSSNDVQKLRTTVEGEISDQVASVNRLTGEIAELNSKIVGQVAAGYDVSDLSDARDVAVKKLSSYMDIGTREEANGHLQVFTTTGLSLVSDHATKLEFDGAGTVTAQSTWSEDDSKRNVGTIRVVGDGSADVDLIATGAMRSGSLKALVELRDVTLVNAQAQLDDIAAGLAEAMSNHTVEGTAATSGAASGFGIDLGALKSGNRVTLTYTDNATGKSKTVTMIRVDDPSVLPLDDSATGNPNDTVVGVDFSGGMGSVAAQIQSALGSSFSVSNPSGDTLEILDDGATNNVDITGLSADVTSTDLQNGDTGLPMFTDGSGTTVYTGSFDKRSQKTGFAARIGVNAALVADPSLLVKWQTGTDAGDATRPKALLDRLENNTIDFGSETGMSSKGFGFSSTLGDFADQMVSYWGAASAAATSAQQSQAVIQTNLESRMKDTSGVNVDQELARLIQLQSAYAANARVMTTAKDMLDVLMQI